MTDAVTPVDGAAGRDGPSINGAPTTLDGAAGSTRLSSRTVAETVRTAATQPAEIGARLLLELTVAGGPWDSAAVARRLPPGGWSTWAATGPLGQLCDQAQWDLGEGPACDALIADLVSAPDLTTDPRWPVWRTHADPLGGRAAMAARLHVSRTVGALTVYADRPGSPHPAAVEHLRTMAVHLSVLLDSADRLRNLDEAMRSRGTIGRAIGMLTERYGITPDQAFAALRRISQNDNVKIAHLAAVLTESGDLPGLHPCGG